MNQPLQQPTPPRQPSCPPRRHHHPQPQPPRHRNDRIRRNLIARRIGELGEATAAQLYQDDGYHILAHNVRYRTGELDLIARAPDPNGTIVFIEVKTRTTLDYGIAEAVTARKLHRMHQAAYRWLSEHHTPWADLRFDVVAIFLEPTGLASIQRYIGVDNGAR